MVFERIRVLGDLHGDVVKFGNLVKQYDIKKGDLVLVAGDFGFVMRNDLQQDITLDDISGADFTVAFVAGNHEHFPRLSQYETVKWCNGNAKRVRDNIYQLLTGEIYELPVLKNGVVETRTLFAFGGARSTDQGVNPCRYPTLWLRFDFNRSEFQLYRSSSCDSARLKEVDSVVFDRDECYSVVDGVFNAVRERLKELGSSLCKAMNITYSNRDQKRMAQGTVLKKVFEDLNLPNEKQYMKDIAETVGTVLESFGYSSGTVRIVLQEGTWFKEEVPCGKDYKYAGERLEAYKMSVDYIITHTLPESVVRMIGAYHGFTPDSDDRQSAEQLGFLEYVMSDVAFKKWVAGHFHVDKVASDYFERFYPDIKNSEFECNKIQILYNTSIDLE